MWRDMWKEMKWYDMCSFYSPEELVGSKYETYENGAHGMIEVCARSSNSLGSEVRGLWDAVPLNPTERRRAIPPTYGCPSCESQDVERGHWHPSDDFHEDYGDEEQDAVLCHACDWCWPWATDPGSNWSPTQDLHNFYFLPFWELPTGDMLAAYDSKIFYGKRLPEGETNTYPHFVWGEFNPATNDKETTNVDS